ncbi:MAG: lipid-A-disaccharide synthase N-terminal domain-containing protein [Pseudomonadota bacterium]
MLLTGSLLLATALADATPLIAPAPADPFRQVLFEVTFGGLAWSITPWKIIGYGGVTLFGLRWVVQALASRKAQAPTMPLAFWLMSVAGSLMLLAYFIWGKNDSVGILSNLMPSLIYSYNLYLFFRQRQRTATAT